MVKKWGFCGYLTCCYKSIVLGDSLYMVVYIKEDFIKVKQPFGKTYWKKEKPQWLSSKESTCNARDACRCVFNPLVGKIPWRRKCNPFQYSCLENLMDREEPGGVQSMGSQSQTRLSNWTTTTLEEKYGLYKIAHIS